MSDSADVAVVVGARPDGPGTSPGVPDLISVGEVDGIPVLHAPWQETGVAGGLVFRVGQADETLATRGITHLVEHLALFDQNLAETHHNGVTGDTTTVFHASGTLEEVVDFLNQVCAALGDLPVHRMDMEKEILRTEEAGSQRGAVRSMRIERYGASTYGLAGYNELGLDNLTRDDVQKWARSRFNRDNAVLFLTTPDIPVGLDLRLPQGRRYPAPSPSSALADGTPAFFRGAEGGVMLDAVVSRSTAASLFAHVAGRALFQDLRQDGGYSYRPDAEYAPRDEKSAVITMSADGLPDKQDAVVGGMIDTLARLRLGTIDPAELEAAKERARKQYDVPDLGARMLPHVAGEFLLGRSVLGREEHLAEVEAVTAGDMQRLARMVWENALIQVPDRDPDWAGMVSTPQWSDAPVQGTSFRASSEDLSLRIGAEGASLVMRDGAVTVRFADVAAMVAYADGGRVLIGLDGFRVAVEPTLFRGLTPETVSRLVDSRVAPPLVIRRTRGPETVPQPRPVQKPRRDLRLKLSRIGSVALRVLRWALLVFAVILAATAASAAVHSATGHVVRVPWLLAAVFGGVLAWRAIRHRRSGR